MNLYEDCLEKVPVPKNRNVGGTADSLFRPDYNNRDVFYFYTETDKKTFLQITPQRGKQTKGLKYYERKTEQH